MSKFNSKQTNKTTSYEGGSVYKKNPLEDWMNNLFSSYIEDSFYESAEMKMNRFNDLTADVAEKYGNEFVAKMSVFARQELGMRTITHLVASYLNNKAFDNKRTYFRNIFKRPDDVAEVFAIVDNIGQKRSHALVRGASDYLSSLNDYTVGKYKLNGKQYNMFDLINITHAHSSAIDKYKQDKLETPDTWEVNISTSKSEEEKNSEWKRMVEENKLGYLALIRNLRNILNAGVDREWINTYLSKAITNKEAIKKSLVFPYQIYSAYKFMDIHNPSVVYDLDIAFRYSCGNIEQMNGSSLIILDISGSMESSISGYSKLSIKEVSAVYAAMMYISNPNCDFIKFGTNAMKKNYNRVDNIFDIINDMQKEERLGCGTNIETAFNIIDKHYDNIFLFSDMQIMSAKRSYYFYSSTKTGLDCFAEYEKAFGKTELYSFDLGNYPSQVENPNKGNVHLVTCLNDKVFKFFKLLQDGDSLVNYINNNFNYC